MPDIRSRGGARSWYPTPPANPKPRKRRQAKPSPRATSGWGEFPRACSQIGTVIKGRMRIIARATLRRFVDNLSTSKDRPAVKGALDAWFAEASKANWKSMADVKRRYA